MTTQAQRVQKQLQKLPPSKQLEVLKRVIHDAEVERLLKESEQSADIGSMSLEDILHYIHERQDVKPVHA